jgi:hypothetical protein
MPEIGHSRNSQIEWGSRGRKFKSSHPDQEKCPSLAILGHFAFLGRKQFVSNVLATIFSQAFNDGAQTVNVGLYVGFFSERRIGVTAYNGHALAVGAARG